MWSTLTPSITILLEQRGDTEAPGHLKIGVSVRYIFKPAFSLDIQLLSRVSGGYIILKFRGLLFSSTATYTNIASVTNTRLLI